VDLVTLEQAVDDIIHEVETNGREISTAEIGTKALAKLRDIDEVAYVRYASVHRRFEELEDFMEEVKNLGRRVKSSAAQRELFPAVDPKNHGRV
jgi:transcriptional repressor NrdR